MSAKRAASTRKSFSICSVSSSSGIGVFGRLDHPYSTMTPQYESVVVGDVFTIFRKRLRLQGPASVYWCIHDKTALAEAEVEYENHTSPTVWVKYALASDPAKIDPALAGKKVFTIIWTTTPWTLPASMAVAFHPDEEYVALESGRRGLHRRRKAGRRSAEMRPGRNRKSSLVSRAGNSSTLNFAHPFLDRKILGVLADYVTMDQGTGVVHTAPVARCGGLHHRREVQARSDLQRRRKRTSCATACLNTTA